MIPKPIKTNWWKVGTDAVILKVYGFGAWYSHWDARKNQSYRCIRSGCSTCAGGASANIRYVLLVGEMASSERHWLELRSRHYLLLERIEKDHGTVVGACLSVRKEFPAKNAPVCVELIDFKATEATCVLRFVESLGSNLNSQESSSSRRSESALESMKAYPATRSTKA